MTAPRRLLSLGHSYAVALNRRLAHELAREGRGRWEVTAAAPRLTSDGERLIPFEPADAETCRVERLESFLARPVQLMTYGRGLRALLREPWDVVHSWEEPYSVAGAQTAFLTPKSAAFVFQTLQNISKRYPPPFSWLERYSLARCAGWTGSGETVVETGLARGFGTKPHRHIPLGVDLETFRPIPNAREEIRRRLGWEPSGPPVIGFSGRFRPEKGLELLMRALDGVQVAWRALFIGGGPMEAALRRWGERRSERVRVVAWAARAEVPAYLNAMDLLCAPSQTTAAWREQFGRMLIEAFACGVPVVGSDSGEIPRVIGGAGAVVGEKDVEGWSRAISNLAENPARRRELAAGGLERARTSYAWPVVARAHLEFFEEVLAGR